MQTPWAVILCKFTDGNDEPFSVQYSKDLFTTENTGSPWNMVRYFHDYSHGTLDLSGTKVFGWYQLDKSRSDYQAEGSGQEDALIQWARDAATDHGVDLAPFFSTVVCTNIGNWSYGWSASGVVVLGPHEQSPTTPPHPTGLGSFMGRVYGLMAPAEIGGSNDWDSWDIMSAFVAHSAPDPKFHLIGPGLNAWNMRSRGWLDESRVWKTTGEGAVETVTLRPHVRRDLRGFLAAELPDGILIEFRVREGWDREIPRPAVLVHRFDGGHSYLMPANSGSLDLIAGDSFGDDDPGDGPFTPFTSFKRVEVLSIDAEAEEANLRVRCHTPLHLALDAERAIDPMYLILSGSAYLKWVELHHPHEPRLADVKAVLQEMTPHERNAALSRANTLVEYGNAVQQAATAIGR